MPINSHERKPDIWRKGYLIDVWELEEWERDLNEHWMYFLDFAALQVNILLRMNQEKGKLRCSEVLKYMIQDE
jgi:hypothetical protein